MIEKGYLIYTTEKGKLPCHRDTAIGIRQGKLIKKRMIEIDGMRYTVCSIFNSDSTVTPMDKIKQYISMDMKNCASASKRGLDI